MLCVLNLGIMLAVEAVVARLKEMSVAIEKPEEISQVRLLLVLPFNWVIKHAAAAAMHLVSPHCGSRTL